VRYVAIVDGQKHAVTLDPAGSVIVDEVAHDIDVESIDGGEGTTECLVCFLVDGELHEVFAERHGSRYHITIGGRRYEVQVEAEQVLRPGTSQGQRPGPGWGRSTDAGTATVTSPMPGIVLDVMAEKGQAVQVGDQVAILEAMKMENEIRAPCAGIIESVQVVPGQTVNLKDVIVVIGAPPDEEGLSKET
jgi:biotin carboxyl carrier protein